MEIGNILEKEFRIMIVMITQDLRKRMEAKIKNMQEMFTKDLGELKKKQTEMDNTLEWINSRIIDAERWKSDLEERMVEITATKQNIGVKNERKKKWR